MRPLGRSGMDGQCGPGVFPSHHSTIPRTKVAGDGVEVSESKAKADSLGTHLEQLHNRIRCGHWVLSIRRKLGIA